MVLKGTVHFIAVMKFSEWHVHGSELYKYDVQLLVYLWLPCNSLFSVTSFFREVAQKED